MDQLVPLLPGIAYQRWLLRTIYPAMPSDLREFLRGTIVMNSRRSSTNYFKNGKFIAKAVSAIAQRLGADTVPVQRPAKAEEGQRLALFNGLMDPANVNEHVQYVIPWVVSRPIIQYKKRNRMAVPSIASIGYGTGNLEWTLLSMRKASRVVGLEFTTTDQDKEHLAGVLTDLSEQYRQHPGQFQAFLEAELADYFSRFGVDAEVPWAMVNEMYPSLCGMIAPSKGPLERRITKLVDAYCIRMEAIAGASRDHPLFEKRVISGQRDDEGILSEIAECSREADIVLFKDSLHHSSEPFHYIETAYSALREGGYLVVIDPFMFDSMADLELRVAYETTCYPESLMTVRQHELWINLLLLSGATIETAALHSGAANFLVNYDPFHRIEICLQKTRPTVQGLFSLDVEEAVRNHHADTHNAVLAEADEGMLDSPFNFYGGDIFFADDLEAVCWNKTMLQYAAKKYGFGEQPYFQLCKIEGSRPFDTKPENNHNP